MVRHHLFVVTLALAIVGCNHSTAPSTLTRIVVNAPTSSLSPGQTASLTATGFYSDGRVQDVSSQVTWTVQNPAVATISPKGLLTIVAVGSTSVTATLQLLSASATVQVTLQGAKSTPDFHLTIMATDDDGAPVTNAKVSVEFAGGQVLGATDGAGAYRLDFTAAPSFIGEPFPEGVAAFAWVDKPDYEGDVQYIRATGPNLSFQFHMHLSKRIAAGESTSVTVGPGDPVCYNNGQDDHPMPPPNEWVCRAVLVVVPVDGTLTVEALPTQPGEPLSGLEIQDDHHWDISYREPRLSIPVTAGTEVLANVEIPWGSAGPLSFTLRTSLAAQSAIGSSSPESRVLGLYRLRTTRNGVAPNGSPRLTH